MTSSYTFGRYIVPQPLSQGDPFTWDTNQGPDGFANSGFTLMGYGNGFNAVQVGNGLFFVCARIESDIGIRVRVYPDGVNSPNTAYSAAQTSGGSVQCTILLQNHDSAVVRCEYDSPVDLDQGEADTIAADCVNGTAQFSIIQFA